MALIQIIILYTIGLMIGLSFTINVLISIPFLLLIALLFIGIGLLLGSLLKDQQVGPVSSILIQIVAFLSGMWFSLDLVGGLFKQIGYVLPFAHGVDMIRLILQGHYIEMLYALLIVLRAYRTSYDTERRQKEVGLYKESLRIVEEYKMLICSLTKDDVSYMIESIKVGCFLVDDLKLHPDLIDNWNEIVLKSGEHTLIDVDIDTLGSKLKGLRKDKGMCRAEVCRHLGIAERTLQSYEEGSREIGINNLYKLMQLYGAGDISGLLK